MPAGWPLRENPVSENDVTSIVHAFCNARIHDAWAALGRSDPDRAEKLAQSVLITDASHPGALRVLAAVINCRQGPRAAAVWLEDVVAGGDERPFILTDIATYLTRAGHVGRAREWIRRGAEVHPDDGPLTLAHGQNLLDEGLPEAALPIFARAAVAMPDTPGAVFGVARCHYLSGNYDQAEKAFAHVLRLAPQHAGAMTNVGVLRRRRGDMASAIEWHEAALAIDPDLVEAHWNLALALLADGQWARGFAEYEWRFRRPGRRRTDLTLPEWSGHEPLAGQRVLISAEQGVGDYLHFIRYAPALQAAGAARVVAEAHPGVADVLATGRGVDQVIELGTATDAVADVHVPVMSLPHRLSLVPEDLTAAVPYLSVPQGAAPDVPDGKPVWGLVWAGNPAHEDDRLRSASLLALRPLWAGNVVQMASLQTGAGRDQLTTSTEAVERVADLAPQMIDYAATARLLTALDGVVTVDTSVAHVAGALGIPCIVLLNFVGDWRWPRSGDRTLWYPSVTCLRCQPGEGWNGLARRAIARVEARYSCPDSAV